MRLLLAASVLLLACSTNSARPDGQGGAGGQVDANFDSPAEHSGLCPDGYPCCTFAADAGTGSAPCNAAECVIVESDSEPPPPDGCLPCPDGYACAIVCPSPQGGCGGPPTCCRSSAR